MHNYSFDDLQYRGGTGRSFVRSGRGRVYDYRHGVMTKIGDLELSEWRRLMKELIERSGEQELFEQLLSWVKEHDVMHQSKEELEKEALIQHSYRLFDEPEWVYYIHFNKRFRPEVLKMTTTPLCWVKTDCCKTPGQVTQAMIDRAFRWGLGKVYCPVCGKWAEYERLEVPTETECK